MLKEFIINDPKIAKIYMNQLRQDILKVLKDIGKGSSTDISKILNLPAPNISYHMKLLEKSGLIVFVEEKKVKNLVEKIFEPIAENIGVHSQKTWDASDLKWHLDNTLNFIKKDFLKNELDPNPLVPDKGLDYNSIRITEENLKDFINDYKAFVDKYKNATEGTPYNVGIIYIKDV